MLRALVGDGAFRLGEAGQPSDLFLRLVMVVGFSLALPLPAWSPGVVFTIGAISRIGSSQELDSLLESAGAVKVLVPCVRLLVYQLRAWLHEEIPDDLEQPVTRRDFPSEHAGNFLPDSGARAVFVHEFVNLPELGLNDCIENARAVSLY